MLQDLGQPILTLDAGIEANSFVARNGEVCQVLRSSGDSAAGLQAAPHKIMGARYHCSLVLLMSVLCTSQGLCSKCSRTEACQVLRSSGNSGRRAAPHKITGARCSPAVVLMQALLCSSCEHRWEQQQKEGGVPGLAQQWRLSCRPAGCLTQDHGRQVQPFSALAGGHCYRQYYWPKHRAKSIADSSREGGQSAKSCAAAVTWLQACRLPRTQTMGARWCSPHQRLHTPLCWPAACDSCRSIARTEWCGWEQAWPLAAVRLCAAAFVLPGEEDRLTVHSATKCAVHAC